MQLRKQRSSGYISLSIKEKGRKNPNNDNRRKTPKTNKQRAKDNEKQGQPVLFHTLSF